MRLFWKTFLPLIGIMLILPTTSVHAQTETPPAPPTGQVAGVIVNQSPDGLVPDSLDVMLHMWDENFNEQGMLHGQSEPGGQFLFEEVPLETGLFYAVMAIHDEVTYFSNPVQYDGKAETMELSVPIYDTTTDPSQAQIDQMHVFFTPEPGGLGVVEIYVLDNLGDLTVAQDQTLDDGTPVTLKFSLPEGAADVSFPSNDGGRFVAFPGGYADTAPLIPGSGSSQVVVSYVVTYTSGMGLSFSPPLATRQVGLLVPEGTGLSLQGEAITSQGVRDLREGLSVEVFSHTGLDAGEPLQVTLSGKLQQVSAPATSMGAVTSPSTSRPDAGLAIGAAALGLALVFVGVWWWRRPPVEDGNDAEAQETDLETIVSEIASLDEAYASGQVDEAAYRDQRKDLLHQAGALIGETANDRV